MEREHGCSNGTEQQNEKKLVELGMQQQRRGNTKSTKKFNRTERATDRGHISATSGGAFIFVAASAFFLRKLTESCLSKISPSSSRSRRQKMGSLKVSKLVFGIRRSCPRAMTFSRPSRSRVTQENVYSCGSNSSGR